MTEAEELFCRYHLAEYRNAVEKIVVGEFLHAKRLPFDMITHKKDS